MTPIKEKIQAPYKFSESETCVLAKKLAQANQRMAELEDQKKSVTSDFKARLDREQAEASLLAQHISQGYEMRETEVNVTLFPKEGKKHYHNAKTLEFIREERMTQADYQIEMKFAAEQREEEERAKADMAKEQQPEPDDETQSNPDEQPRVWTVDIKKSRKAIGSVQVYVHKRGDRYVFSYNATLPDGGCGVPVDDATDFPTATDALNTAKAMAVRWLDGQNLDAKQVEKVETEFDAIVDSLRRAETQPY